MGKTALVIGGASGIGEAIVGELAKIGTQVCIADINCERGEAVCKEMNSLVKSPLVSFQECDVTKEDLFRRVLNNMKATFGNLDILVNCAGIINEKNWEIAVDINLKGVVRGTILGVEYMGKHNGAAGGLIVNMASGQGIGLCPHIPVYGATKHGVIALSRSLAMQVHYKNHGVRINCIAPFGVNTPMANVSPEMVYNAEWCYPYSKPMKRLSASRVADVFMDIVKDESKNGKAVVVPFDGEAYDFDFTHMDDVTSENQKD